MFNNWAVTLRNARQGLKSKGNYVARASTSQLVGKKS